MIIYYYWILIFGFVFQFILIVKNHPLLSKHLYTSEEDQEFTPIRGNRNLRSISESGKESKTRLSLKLPLASFPFVNKSKISLMYRPFQQQSL